MSAFAEQELKHWDQPSQYTRPDTVSSTSRASAPPFRNKAELPALHTYPLESLIASLKRNEAVLKNSRAFKTLPDKGKKLIESNALIREAIKRKTMEKGAKEKQRISSNSIPPPSRPQDSETIAKRPSPLSKDATLPSYTKRVDNINNQLQNITLSTSTLNSSSGTSSSGRQSLSSVSSELRNSSDAAPGSGSSSRVDLYRLVPQNNRHMSTSPRISASIKSRSSDSRGRETPLREALRQREEEERMGQENTKHYQSHRQHHHHHANTPPPIARYHPYFDYVEDDSDDFDGFSEDEYY